MSAEFTAFANYYGLPVMSVPCGFDHHGLPIGLQIVGKAGDEGTVLNVGSQYQVAAMTGSKHPLG